MTSRLNRSVPLPVRAAACMAALIAVFVAAPARAEVVLVDTKAGIDPAPIYVDAAAGRHARLAADELAKYLGEMSGKSFSVTAFKQAGDIPPRAIVVGEATVTVPDDFTPDSFIIHAKGERLTLAGGGDMGRYYAVYGLLEDHLGCRWWTWNEEHVPSLSRIALPDLDIKQKPIFLQHDLFNKEAQLNRDNFAYKSRSTSALDFSGGHTLCPMLKPYVDEHPEFLPMDKDGERKWNNIHMNYTAKGMDDALVTELSKVVERFSGNLDGKIYMAGMGDWYGGMDLSPASKAIYEEETWTDPDGRKKVGYIATLIRLMNSVAAKLDEKYPGIKVGTFAYMSIEAPPAKTRPADNLYLWVPRLRHDTVLGVLESEKNASFKRNVERWCELAPGRVFIWEYGINFKNFMYPFPCILSMAENIKWYRDVGVSGIMIQGNYVSPGGDMAAIRNYVWRKLMWNPDLDVDRLLEEFCNGYYGPAAKEALEYVYTLEDSVRVPEQKHMDEFGDPTKVYLTGTLIDELQDVITRAIGKTKGDDSDPYYRRIRELGIGLDVVRYWNAGPLVEQGDKLIREDIGAYTYDRAEEMVSYMREASPREWGSGHAYRYGFLTMHGGPLYTVQGGKTKVRVAPVQHGRIWRVTYDGKTVIGQSREAVKPGSYGWEVTRTASASAIAIAGDLGIAHWGATPKQRVTNAISVDDQGTITVLGTLQSLHASHLTNEPTVETHYPLEDGKRSDFTFEVQSPEGKWSTLDLPLPGKAGEVPAFQTLRVTRADVGVVITDRYDNKPTGATFDYDNKTRSFVFKAAFPKVTLSKPVAAGTDDSGKAIMRSPETVYRLRKISIEPIR